VRLAGYTEASRGCRHLCRHCPLPPVYRGRFYVTPVEDVMRDVAAQVDAGARHVTFGDPDFLNGPTHARAVAAAFRARFAGVTFDVTAKVEHLVRHAALLPELAAAGCVFIVSAVESLSDRVLAALDKGHTRADVAVALAAARAAGLTLRPTLLPFTPWATLADYLELLDWIDAEGLGAAVDPVQLTIRLLVPPGSLLQEHAALAPHLQGYDEARFTHVWRHPDRRMDELCEGVAAVVQGGARRGAAASELFAAVRASALALSTRAERRRPRILPRDRRAPAFAPRLTEPWFC
jgi:radical SAM superfamily enzyme YgiQ (UPF0313 family)